MSGLLMKYFVLKPAGDDEYARSSRLAMRAFAMAIKTSNPSLAEELDIWADTETGLFIRREQERLKSEARDC